MSFCDKKSVESAAPAARVSGLAADDDASWSRSASGGLGGHIGADAKEIALVCTALDTFFFCTDARLFTTPLRILKRKYATVSHLT